MKIKNKRRIFIVLAVVCVFAFTTITASASLSNWTPFAWVHKVNNDCVSSHNITLSTSDKSDGIFQSTTQGYAYYVEATSSAKSKVTGGKAYDSDKLGGHESSKLTHGNGYAFLTSENKKGKPEVTFTGYRIYDASRNEYVNLKLVATVMDWEIVPHYKTLKIGSKKIAASTGIIEIGQKLSGMPWVKMDNLGSVRIKYEWYDAKTGNKYNIRTTFTYADVDANQSIAVSNLTKGVVAKGTNLRHARHSNSNISYDIFADYDGGEDAKKSAKQDVSLSVTGTSQNLIYSTRSAGDGAKRTWEPNGYHAYFATSVKTLTIPNFNPPKKQIVDSEGNLYNSHKNLSNKDEIYRYRITQRIPAGFDLDEASKWIKNFRFFDQLDSCLELRGDPVFYVYTNAGETKKNYTENFKVTTATTSNGRTNISASLKKFDDPRLYGNGKGSTVTMEFKVRIKKDVTMATLLTKHMDSAGKIVIPNSASTEIQRTVLDKQSVTRNTNEVEVKLTPKTHDLTVTKKVLTEASNASAAAADRFSFTIALTGLSKNTTYTIVAGGTSSTFTSNASGNATVTKTLAGAVNTAATATNKIVIKDIPDGATYKITEAAPTFGNGARNYRPKFSTTWAKAKKKKNSKAEGLSLATPVESTATGTSENIYYTWTNTLAETTHDLGIKKKVINAPAGDENKQFTYTIRLQGLTPNKYYDVIKK